MNPTEQQMHLPCHPASVTRARHFVRDLLIEWGLARLADDAQLGTSELVANAVRHARTDLLLSVARGATVTVSIRDGDPRLRRPVSGEDDALSESGRGLQIVAAISHDWGVVSAGGGKTVWFSLAMPDRATTDADVVSMAGRRPTREHPAARQESLDGVSVRSGLDPAI